MFASIPTADHARRQPRQADLQPAHRRDLRQRRHSRQRDHAVREEGARRPAAADRTGIANNFDSLPERTDFNDKFDVKVDNTFSRKMTAFARVSHRNLDNFEPSSIPGETGSPSNAFVHVEEHTGRRRLHLHAAASARCSSSASAGRATKAGKEPPGVGGPNMLEAYGIPGLPTDERFAGGLTEQGVTGWTTWGRQNSNPQFQDPTVFNPRINYSWIKGRQSFKTGYEYQAINTADRRLQSEVRPRHLRRASSAVRRRRPPIRRPTTSPTSCSACATRTRSSRRSSPTSASGCTSATSRTTSRSIRG